INHHDALRLRFTQDAAGRWVQAYAQTETGTQTQPDLLWIREAKDAAQIEAHSEAAQRSLDLTKGPLLRAVLMRIEDGSTRLLLVIHHLVVDGVSWRILLEDLQTVSAQIQRGEEIALPARTDSYQWWSQQLQQYAQSDALNNQREYWEEVNRTPATLPCDMPTGTNRVADRQQATLKLDSTQTQRLLQQAPAAYRTQVNDLLLTALGRALCGWTGQERIRLDLEGHGREDVFETAEVSRTVGWFTSVYPVSLEPGGELGEAVKRVKEGLRAVPQRGLGYGVLSNVAHTIKQTDPSQVVFNYLGQLDGSFSESSTWQPAKESPGRSQDDSAPLVYALSVNGRVLDDALTLTISYSNKRYNEQTIEALLTAYHNELTQLIDHCTSGETGASGATPSDFELAALTQPELDALPLALHDVAEIYPLSPMQSGMLFHTLYSPGRSVYLNQLRADIDGLDIERFRAAWVEVAARHDILRTAFVPQGEGWLQWVARSVDVPFVEHDWRDRNAAAHNALDDLANHELAEGFDVTRAPLQRIVLIRTGEQRHHFVWTHHHVLMDGWSVSQLLSEVLRHYSGQRLPAHGGRYRDYIGWLQTRDTHASEAHWRRQLERLDEPTYLVDAVRRGQPARSDEATHAAHTLELDPAATARLVAFARHERVTVNTLVQAAWALLLHRYTQRSSVVFGATLAGRPAELPGVSHLLGLFINTLPVIAEPRAGMRLGDWLRDLQQQGLAAQEHAHTPLYDIQRWAGSHGQSLFDTVVVFENYPVDEALKEASPGGLSIANVRASDETSYALTLGVVQSDTLKLDYRFARNAFADDEIAGIAQQTAALLNAFAAADATNRPLGDLALLDEKQQRALIALGEHQATMHPAQKQPVPALIEAHAQQQPDAVALLCGDVALNYGELNERANRLAHRLIRLGVAAEVRVGFAVERSVDMIVGLLAVLKAGGAYVPLDPAYPAERLAHMIDDSGIGLLLTQSHLHARVPVPAQLACVDLDTLDVSAELSSNPLAALHDDQLAYVIYTSGSTGKPKGVAVAHGALSMHCQAIAARYGITAADRQLHFSSISFDAAGEQWLVPLISGASVVLRDDSVWAAQRLADEIATKQITVLDLPPAYANAFAQEIEPGAVSVKTCIVGGEGWSRSGFEIVQRNLRPERIFNAYGPSETVITSTVWQADSSTECTGIYAPIGTPVGERRAYVLDPALALVPQGVVGELYLGGTGLARGYLNRSALTAERFVPDPFDAHGGRLYRTGDLARWNRAGELEYVGRTDEQVKVRGFRIEPGEIEATLLAQAGVREAAVVVREVAGAPRLAAFVAAQSGTTLDAAALKAALAERLPDHMVPASIVILDALPVTPNGKLDRRALPASEPAATQAYEAPQGELEETVARIWLDVLGVERVGRSDNFFELGGDSIFSLRVQRRIAQQLAVDIELAALFAAPTLEAFSAAVAAAQSRATTEPDRLTDEMQSILSELMQ
uniref:non-ribosomal peptide synthetase n=1 Tax=Paraburkholderia flava TaxID=2547393 RepID=UPI00105E2CF5